MTEVGAIVRALQGAESDRLRAERAAEDLLIELFPDFVPRFPRALGWRWTAPAKIEVWGVLDSPAAIGALARAGFRRIRLHDHPAARPLHCACVMRKT